MVDVSHGLWLLAMLLVWEHLLRLRLWLWHLHLLWPVVLHQLLQHLENPLTRSLLLKPQHILFILIHQSKAHPAFVLDILPGDFQGSDSKLIVIGLLGGFLFHVQHRRVTTDIAFSPQWKCLLFFYVGFLVLEVHDNLLAAQTLYYWGEQNSLAGSVALLQRLEFILWQLLVFFGDKFPA